MSLTSWAILTEWLADFGTGLGLEGLVLSSSSVWSVQADFLWRWRFLEQIDQMFGAAAHSHPGQATCRSCTSLVTFSQGFFQGLLQRLSTLNQRYNADDLDPRELLTALLKYSSAILNSKLRAPEPEAALEMKQAEGQCTNFSFHVVYYVHSPQTSTVYSSEQP